MELQNMKYAKEICKLKEAGKIEEYEKLLSKFAGNNRYEIIELALNNESFAGSTYIYFNFDTCKIDIRHFSSNSRPFPDYNAEALYILSENWMGDNCWEDHNDLIDDDEWEALQEVYGSDADYTSFEQMRAVEEVEVNTWEEYTERMVEYLVQFFESDLRYAPSNRYS